MKVRIGLLVVLLGLSLVLGPGVAEAHRPVNKTGEIDTPTQAQDLVEPDWSKAIYGSLTRVQDVDFYKFVAPTGYTLHLSILVPFDPQYKDYKPTFALLGPGLPELSTALPFSTPGLNVVQALPKETSSLQSFGYNISRILMRFLVGPEQGGQIMAYENGPRATFYESFGRKTYYTGPDVRIKVAGGTYYVAVFDPEKRTGPYVFSIGDREY